MIVPLDDNFSHELVQNTFNKKGSKIAPENQQACLWYKIQE